jgi:hypothetical protein
MITAGLVNWGLSQLLIGFSLLRGARKKRVSHTAKRGVIELLDVGALWVEGRPYGW